MNPKLTGIGQIGSMVRIIGVVVIFFFCISCIPGNIHGDLASHVNGNSNDTSKLLTESPILGGLEFGMAGNIVTDLHVFDINGNGIQDRVAHILEAAFFLVMGDTGLSRPLHGPQTLNRDPGTARPASVKALLDQLSLVLSLRDRTRIARLHISELASLNISLGQYIRRHYGLGEASEDYLLDLCREKSGEPAMSADEAVSYLIRRLWEALSKTHTLRRIK